MIRIADAENVTIGSGLVRETKKKIITEVEKRIQVKAKRNPEKYIVLKIGSLEVFCYPYNNSNLIFVAVNGEMDVYEPETARKLFCRLQRRLDFLIHRLNDGVSRYDSSESAKRFRRAYNEGVSSLFGTKDEMERNDDFEDK